MRISQTFPSPVSSAELAPARSTFLGSILNAAGERIDPRGRLLSRPIPAVLHLHKTKCREAVHRETVRRPFSTGVRAIDGLLTLGVGQRIALLADAEVGKSDLLAWIARQNSADTNVIILPCVAPRELRQFIEALGPEAMRRSVVIGTLHNEPAPRVAQAVSLASSIAQRLCEDAQDVLLVVDSLSQIHRASLVDLVAKILACAGNRGSAGITGLYALEAGTNQPVEALWQRFDALIRLRRDLAERGLVPPIDILQSWTRGPALLTLERQQAAGLVRRLLADYNAIEESLNTATYRRGVCLEGDLALRTRQAVLRYLQQSPDEPSDLPSTQAQLEALRREIEATAAHLGCHVPRQVDEESLPLRFDPRSRKARALAG